jgi:uncharacterized repeat protein (TIGR03803 family)
MMRAKFVIVVALFCSAVLLGACGGGAAGNAGSGGNNGGSGNPPVLRRIEITPAAPTMSVGEVVDLTINAHYSDGSTRVQILAQNWSSETPSVATIDVRGRVTAMAAGSSVITATSDGQTASTRVTIVRGAAEVTYAYLFGSDPSDAAQPNGPLLLARDGHLYGTSRSGGAHRCMGLPNACGTVFKLSPSGEETILHSFSESEDEGNWPSAPLVETADGTFYGTTLFGGKHGAGTVYKMTPDGVTTLLYSFGGSPTDARVPTALIQGRDGDFYGMSTSGGAHYCDQVGNNCGTVFKVTSAGVLTVLHEFGASISDGVQPIAPLMLANDGNFYGTTTFGGAYDAGTIFKMTPAGELTILYSFKRTVGGTPPPEGTAPQGSLIQASDGALYGTAVAGGLLDCLPGGCGTVFRITLDGTYSVLYSFRGPNSGDAWGPAPFLIQGRNGNLYGTSYSGGAFGNDLAGIVFELTLTGSERVLYSFGPLNVNPSSPNAGVIEAGDGIFYGITAYGEQGGIAGSVFKLTLSR